MKIYKINLGILILSVAASIFFTLLSFFAVGESPSTESLWLLVVFVPPLVLEIVKIKKHITHIFLEVLSGINALTIVLGGIALTYASTLTYGVLGGLEYFLAVCLAVLFIMFLVFMFNILGIFLLPKTWK